MATEIYAAGPWYASACTDDTDEAAVAAANANTPHPRVPWVLSRRPFEDGSPNPSDCGHDPVRPGHRHILLTALNEPEASAVPALVDA